jgi:hypothetical protein
LLAKPGDRANPIFHLFAIPFFLCATLGWFLCLARSLKSRFEIHPVFLSAIFRCSIQLADIRLLLKPFPFTFGPPRLLGLCLAVAMPSTSSQIPPIFAELFGNIKSAMFGAPRTVLANEPVFAGKIKVFDPNYSPTSLLLVSSILLHFVLLEPDI